MSNTRSVLFTPTLVTEDGRFSGYGAVFGNVDSHRDVIEFGAFQASLRRWRAKRRFPPMRLQHGSSGNPFRHDDLPIGKWLDMREDKRGLWVEGQLLALKTDQGERLLSLMKGGVLDGLSIGYVVTQSRPGSGRIGRHLTEIDLRELSVVDEPSNDEARITPLSASDEAFDRLREAVGGLKLHARTEGPIDRLRAALQRLGDEQ